MKSAGNDNRIFYYLPVIKELVIFLQQLVKTGCCFHFRTERSCEN